MARSFVLLAGVVVVLCPSFLVGQPQPQPRDGKVTIPLMLKPAPARIPVSRDYLLPTYKDMIPGNQVQMFMRLFMEQATFFGKEESDKREKWNTMHLAELPAEELKDYGSNLLGRDAVDAARMLSVDWQIWYFIRRDGIGTLLPDVQKMRAIALVLRTRARGQIRNNHAEGAIATLRTDFALARTFDTHPTLIGHLVGVAIATIGCNVAEELIQLPDCPNLFWSFTDLPTPFLSLRIPLQGEIPVATSDFSSVLEAPVTQQELDRVIGKINDVLPLGEKLLKDHQAKPIPAKERFLAWSRDPEKVKAARDFLVENGISPNVVKILSPIQVVVANDVQQVKFYQDELFKWLVLPAWQTGPVEEVLAKLDREKDNLVLTPIFIPAILKVKQAQTRLEQRIAYFRIIEAIRLHAHQNNGQLPASLDAIKLPLPLDPVTGKPFQYSVMEGVATLTGGNPYPGNDQMNRVYEIKLQK